MANFINKTSVVEAATIYQSDKLVGRDYTVGLPDVVPVTADVGGLMGTMNIPLLNTIESMELTINKVGVDKYTAEMCTPGKKDFLIKWVQDQVDSAGDVKPVGCKASISCLPKSYMPAADIEVGSASEFEQTYEVFIYSLYVDGTQVFYVNRMTGVLKAWNGSKLVDYSSSFSALL